MLQESTYRTQCQRFFEQAESEFRAGDLRQASEKAWGAASQMVKAVAELSGWPHDNHQAIMRVAYRLAREHRDREISRLFNDAQALHGNFYEGGMWEDDVRDAIESVRRFVEKLDSLSDWTSYQLGGPSLIR